MGMLRDKAILNDWLRTLLCVVGGNSPDCDLNDEVVMPRRALPSN